jgi:transposase
LREITTRHSGWDVHAQTIVVGIADVDQAPVFHSTMANDPGAIRKLVKQLTAGGQKLKVAYEAGPTGYPIHRQLTELGVDCIVVAPSLIPRKSGDRVKTDKRDALALTRLLRSGDLTPVWVPGPEDEALRDLVRARYDAQTDLIRAKHRLSKFLLRQGLRPPAGTRAWSAKYRAWLQKLAFTFTASRVVFDSYYAVIATAEDRVRLLERQLHDVTLNSRQAALVAALQALRGIGFLSAVTIAAEAIDLTRFPNAPSFMSFTGLVSSEYSSGQSRHQGGITHTGNSNIRHVLVQAAHNARRIPHRSYGQRQRQEGLPPDLIEMAWKAQTRLHLRYRHLAGRIGVPKAVTAVARELAGFVWAIGQRMNQEVPNAA